MMLKTLKTLFYFFKESMAQEKVALLTKGHLQAEGQPGSFLW